MSSKLYCLHFFPLEADPLLTQTTHSLRCYLTSLRPVLASLCSSVHRTSLIPFPGICALYNLTISCCSPNCSMFQADCAPCQCPSPVCALFPLGLHGMSSLSSPSVTVLSSFKAFLLSVPQPEFSFSLNINYTWFVWVLRHLLHIDSCSIIHDLCFSPSLLASKSFHSRVHVDFNSVSACCLCHSIEHTTSP